MEKKVTLKELRSNELYIDSLLLHGNGKLLDYEDTENRISYRYAQFNTRAIKDCPFASDGCKAVCYATKGNHVFKNVKESREKSYNDSKRDNFSECMIYTINTELLSARYKNSVMLIRIHESGDYYSVQYLRKWLKVWEYFNGHNQVKFVFYTKSFPFFLMLTPNEREIIRTAQDNGNLSINLSMDDTTTSQQKLAYLEMIKLFPLCNTYYCTEDTNTVKHDNICDCSNCAKCGICNTPTGKNTVVKIHSASVADMKKYNKAKKRNGI